MTGIADCLSCDTNLAIFAIVSPITGKFPDCNLFGRRVFYLIFSVDETEIAVSSVRCMLWQIIIRSIAMHLRCLARSLKSDISFIC